MKITDLEKRIGTFRLQIDHLDIEPGRIHGIIGPNGCGKTVLLKTIAGIYKPDQGRIDYEGVTSREITMMSQRPYLMDTTVYKNLIYPLQIRKIRPEEERVDELLEKAGLLAQKKQGKETELNPVHTHRPPVPAPPGSTTQRHSSSYRSEPAKRPNFQPAPHQ